MTPVRWLLVRAEREVAACWAETRGEAEAVLRPAPGSWVTSAASFAVGLPAAVRRALAVPERVCERCERKPRATGGRYCLGCKALAQRERCVRERDRLRGKRASKRTREEIRAANRLGGIRSGLARRRLARGSENE